MFLIKDEKIKNKQKGFLVLFSVVVSGVILAIALMVTSFAYNKTSFSNSSQRSSEAFYAANIGVECALLFDLDAGGSLFGTTTLRSCAGNNNISLSGSSPWNFELLNLGSSTRSCAKVEVVKNASGTQVSSWGYDMGSSELGCNFLGLSKNERLIEVSVEDFAGGGSNPQASNQVYVEFVSAQGDISIVNNTNTDQNVSCSNSPCYGHFDPGADISITATAQSPGFLFSNWSGTPCDLSTNNMCNINPLVSSVQMTANFIVDPNVATYAVTARKPAGGNFNKGTVESISPDNSLVCNTSCPFLSKEFNQGSNVTLKATPILGFHFANWYNGLGSAVSCNNSKNDECSFILNDISDISAWFGKKLTIIKNIPEAGVIREFYSGNLCGSVCDIIFFPGTSIYVNVQQVYSGYTFTHWSDSGSACDGSTLTYCNSLPNNDNISITANFAPIATGSVPVLTSPTATAVTQTSAILGANVTSSTNITARGTCWGTSPSPATNCIAEGGTTTGIFTHPRTGMPSNTLIYFRVYATNATGTGYADGSFTTATPLVLSGQTVTNPTPFTTLSTTGGSGTGAVTYAVTSAGAGCSVSGNTLSYTSTGSCGVTATKAGDATYNSTSSAQATFTVNSAALPNLTISVFPSPSTATAGTATTYTATIINNGTGPSSASNYFWQTSTASNMGGTVTDKTPVALGALAVNGTATVTTTHTFATSGNYSIQICADKTSSAGGGVVAESNEGDNCGYTNVTVSKANQSPLVLSGQTVTSPTPFTTLSTTGGSGTGAVTYAVTSAGAGCSISGNTLSYTSTGSCGVTATKAGDATYNSTSSAQATFTVNAAANTPPFVNAGPNVSINAGYNTQPSFPTASDTPPGYVVSTQWTFESGPSTPTIINANMLSSVVFSNLSTPGNYVFRLTVTDNDGAYSFDEMTVVVTPLNPSNITFINASSANWLNVVLPAYQTGDFIMVFAYNSVSNIPPTIPSGWTNAWFPVTYVGNNSASVGYRVATSNGTNISSGNWNGATAITALVFRGVSSIGSSGGMNNDIPTPVDYYFGGLSQNDGKSWVVSFAGHKSTDTNLQNPPAGMTLRSNIVRDLSFFNEISSFSTTSGVSSYLGGTVDVGGTPNYYVTRTFELISQ